jgi:argininosuccinate synthase
VVDSKFEKFLKNGMPVPLLGGSRDMENGELTKLMNGKGTLIGVGRVDTVTRTIRIKRLING